jgi:hypothetical protein
MSISELWLAIDADKDVASLHTPFTQISLTPTVRDRPWDRLQSTNNMTNKVTFVEEASNSGLPTYKSASNVEQHTDEHHHEGMIGSANETVGDAIFNIDFPRLGSSVVEHLVYNQGAWVQSPVWPYS